MSTVGVCWFGLRFVSSLDVALVTLSNKVLMHLILPRCEVHSVKLLRRKSVSPLSIHSDFFSVDDLVLLFVDV